MKHRNTNRRPSVKPLAPILLTAALVLSGCAQNPPPGGAPPDAAGTATIEVRKSPNDSRAYRYLTLPNKLRVLLVSDPQTEKSAAALSVYRGSFHEPENRPGLAHFLEHMLFIQTRTFPEIDGFQHYVSGNGGSSNAYTALDHTNYFFDIRPQAFPQALRRFAHFFIDPVLSPEYSAREKNAVHSEYQLQLKDDGWRGYMVSKQVLNPEHPGSKFTIGSLDTLAGDIHEDLVDFFNSHYSADQMGLVVLSAEPLDELEALVTPMFNPIQNNNIGPDHPTVPMYTEQELPARVEIQALKTGTRLTYNFPIPNTRPHYRKKPELYFSNLIGHEGSGSLYQLLNARGWIESLGSSVSNLDRNSSVLAVSLELTQQGKQNIERITDLLFQYIDLIKSTPPRESLYREQAVVAELGFRFQEKSNPMGFVYQMAPRIDQFEPADLLAAPYLMEEFDPHLIREYLSYLREDNLLLEITSDDIEGQQTEPWFQVPYNLQRQTAGRRQTPTDALHLPPENPYLPENLELRAADTLPIRKEIDQPGISLWMDNDLSFRTPRANLYLELAVDGGFVSAEERAMARLYRLLVSDALSEETYPAYLAGLSYTLGVPDSGFEVSISGYQDKQLTLLAKVLDALLNTDIDPAKFDKYKASLIRDWNNSLKDKPFTQAFGALSDVLRSGRWPRPMLVEALQPVTVESLRSWRGQRLAAISVQGLLHGSITADDAQQLSRLLSSSLPIKAHGLTRPVVADINEALRLKLPVEHNDAAMVLHVQDPDDSFDSRAISSLGAQILHNAYFLQLRTEQQLGYVVSVSNRPIVKRGGISFVVQSPVESAAGLEKATAVFMDNFIESWPEVGEAEFNQQKLGLINRLLQTPKNLNERSGRYWSDLQREYLSFDSREQVAARVEQLTREDMAGFFAQVRNKLDKQRLLIFTQGKFADVPQGGTLLSQAAELKTPG